MLWQQIGDFLRATIDTFMTWWMLINVVYPLMVWWLKGWLKKNWKWFQVEHVRVPVWMTLLALVGGIVFPNTPLVFDGMLIASAVYFANEAVFMTFRVSPLNAVFKAIDSFGLLVGYGVIWLWRFLFLA